MASILVVTEPLDEMLWDDVHYASRTARVGACEARVEARRGLMDRRLGPDVVRRRALELGFPEAAGSDEAELPVLLAAWDARNRVQQWYFVSSGEVIEYWQGGSASSGARETHGRWGHVCAALTVHHGVAVPTIVLHYDSRNVLRLEGDSAELILDRADLSGNYHVDWDESRAPVGPFAIDARDQSSAAIRSATGGRASGDVGSAT